MKPFKIFISFFLFFAAFAPFGHIPTDSGYSLQTARSLYYKHTFKIEPNSELPLVVKGANNGLYSKYGIGYAFYFLPAIALSDLTSRMCHIDAIKAEHFFASFLGALPAAFIICMLYILLIGMGYSLSLVLKFLVIMATVTILLPYSKLVLVETLSGALLAACLGIIIRKDKPTCFSMCILSITASLLFYIKISNVIYCIIIGSYIIVLYSAKRLSINAFLSFLIPILPLVGFLIFLNYCRFGSFANFGYGDEQSAFTTPVFKGLYGLLFSPAKSVFIYSPLLVLTLISWPSFYRKHRSLSILIIILFLSTLVFHSIWHAWQGGWGWGPRLIVPALILIHLPLVEYFELSQKKKALKIIFGFLLIPAALIQLLGTAINYQEIHFFIEDPTLSDAPHIKTATMLFLHKLERKPEIYELNGKTLDFTNRETFQGFGNMWEGIARYTNRKTFLLIPIMLLAASFFILINLGRSPREKGFKDILTIEK